jgi:hypothetical protein
MNQLDPKAVLFSNIITAPKHYIGKELVFVHNDPEPIITVCDGYSSEQFGLEDFNQFDEIYVWE